MIPKEIYSSSTLLRMSTSEETIAIGIDLGTTYSCVAVWKDGRVEVIANDMGNRTTPSYVAFTETERLIGDAAKNQASQNPTNTIFDAKRLIGRKFTDVTVQKDLKLLPYKVVNGTHGTPEIEVTYNGEVKNITPIEISAAVLSKMKAIAEGYLGHSVKKAVITVPAYFNDAQRQSTKDAAYIAGLEPIRIINEPTSAAIAYKLEQASNKDKNVLIYDLGGGTFDVSILQISTDGLIQVLSTAGDTHLGGEDFDNILQNYFVSEFKMKKGIDISQNKRALRRLRTACESAKRQLSSSNTTTLTVDSLADAVDFSFVLTRAKFESLCDSEFKKCMYPLEDALKTAKVSKSEIDEVVLVGGSTRVPKIQQMLSDFFNGKKLCNSINPDEAVAYGAAVQAQLIVNPDGMGSTDLTICDAVPLSLGVAEGAPVFVNGKMDRKFQQIVKRGRPIPTKASEMFSTGQDNQTEVKIEIYEGERNFCSGNNLLGSFMVSGIPPMRRGMPQIEVNFDIDQNSILNVSAVEKGSGKSGKVTITSESGRLSKSDIERMLEESEKFKEDDAKILELVESKNKLESFIYGWRNTIGEDKVKEKLSEEDIKTISDTLDDAQKWVSDNFSEQSKEVFDNKVKELEKVILPFGQKIYGGDGTAPAEMPGMPAGMGGMSMEQLQQMMAGMQGKGADGNDNDDVLDEDHTGPKVEEID
jgi:L1 cell adhesion molecule like protein